ncbi:hypothetical protein DM828_23375 [Pseudomonas umsongensis]|nr:hypothetical protein [Pseudomonas umsongensis]
MIDRITLIIRCVIHGQRVTPDNTRSYTIINNRQLAFRLMQILITIEPLPQKIHYFLLLLFDYQELIFGFCQIGSVRRHPAKHFAPLDTGLDASKYPDHRFLAILVDVGHQPLTVVVWIEMIPSTMTGEKIK